MIHTVFQMVFTKMASTNPRITNLKLVNEKERKATNFAVQNKKFGQRLLMFLNNEKSRYSASLQVQT